MALGLSTSPGPFPEQNTARFHRKGDGSLRSFLVLSQTPTQEFLNPYDNILNFLFTGRAGTPGRDRVGPAGQKGIKGEISDIVVGPKGVRGDQGFRGPPGYKAQSRKSKLIFLITYEFTYFRPRRSTTILSLIVD